MLIDYGFASLLYMRITSRTWLYIVSGVLIDEYKESNTHWCISFLNEASKEAENDRSLKFAIDQLIATTGSIMKLFLRLMIQESVESLVQIFNQNKQKWKSMSREDLKNNHELIQEI